MINTYKSIHSQAVNEEYLKRLRTDGHFYVHKKEFVYDARSLYLFDQRQKFRRAVVWVAEWKWFDRFILLSIFTNSIFLAIFDYQDVNNETAINKMVNESDIVFTVIFSLEFVIKAIAMGFVKHKNAYLRDGWNWIDFVVVIVGIINNVPGIPNIKALRTLRVMRPLRSINAMPSMRRLIASLIASLPALGNVVIFLFFIFVLFGIFGVQQFKGYFFYRCRLTTGPVNGVWPIDYNVDKLCAPPSQDALIGNATICPVVCGNPSAYGLSLSSDNVTTDAKINYGITTFDNLAQAILTIFQCITLEGWVDIMYNLMDSNITWLAAAYFCLLVLFGSFFLLNLVLAVIMDTFDKVSQKEKNRAHEDLLREQEEREKQLKE